VHIQNGEPMTPNQKAEVRPISFILHDTARGTAPVERKLVVRPEDLTRPEASRLTAHHTLGGAWIDSFGQGLPTVQISGTTGWGQGNLPNGQEEFKALHKMIYTDWHKARADLVSNGQDPDKIKLIFNDQLDDFTWLVAPTQFVLRRHKSRPLLSMYQINLLYVSDNVSETMDALKLTQVQRQAAALSSLDATLKGIDDFMAELSSDITVFFGPLKDGVVSLVKTTATVLHATRSLISSGMRVVDAVTGNVMDMASGLSIAASNVFATVTAVQAIPGRILARITRIRTLFMNAYCILKNTFKTRQILPSYDDVYGASLCSSTAGGRPLSKYLDTNTFEAISPIINNRLAIDSDSVAAIMHLSKMDPVLSPLSLETVGSLSTTAANGVVVV
jgi:hypothetical protein